jgi:glycosyltransferase involved in cell wall biosynthesis
MNHGPPRQPLRIGIAHVSASFLTGGSEIYSWALARFLSSRGHPVSLIAGQTPEPIRVYPEINLQTAPFKPRDRWPKFGSRFQRLMERSSFLWNARRLIADAQFDILNVHKPYDLPLAVWLKRRTGYRIIWRSHGPDYFPGLQRVLRKVDAVYCVSECCRRELQEHYQAPAEVIYTGVDTSFFTPLTTAAPAPEAPKILYFGRLEGWKGVHFLIRALALLKSNYRAEIVGAGPEEGSLRNLIQTQKLGDKVQLRPAVRDRAQLRSLIQSAEIAAFPVIGFETMSNAMLEAMACGKAVLATSTGCFTEVLDDRTDSRLVPPRDERALASALDELLQSPSLRASLGATARKKVVARFDSQESFRQVEALFERVARGLKQR